MRDLHYLTDSYDEKIARIKAIGAPINFVFITDQHNRMNSFSNEWGLHPDNESTRELARDAIRSIQYILDRCPEISMVISGGDVGNDYYPEEERYKASVREVYDELYALSVPVHNVIGNHDDGLGNASDHGWDFATHSILPKEMHALCMKNNPTDENYYYIDVDPGYRFIFMNSCDVPYGAEGEHWRNHWMLAISDKQAKWFEDEAMKTDRQVLIFSHAPLHNAGVFGTEGMPQGFKGFDDTLNAPRILRTITNAPNVVANICGHVHFDNIVYRDSLLTVTTLCSLAQEWAPACPKRVFGTPTETAFDVFSVTDEVIYMTRFGAGRDREATIVRVRPFP